MTGDGGLPADLGEARGRVARERARIESALDDLNGSVRAESDLASQQAGDTGESGTEVAAEAVSMALADGLRDRLEAADRAAKRLDDGTYGRSVESGAQIPAARLAAAPLAERTVGEQTVLDALLPHG